VFAEIFSATHKTNYQDLIASHLVDWEFESDQDLRSEFMATYSIGRKDHQLSPDENMEFVNKGKTNYSLTITSNLQAWANASARIAATSRISSIPFNERLQCTRMYGESRSISWR